MDARKTQTYFSLVKTPIDPKILDLSKHIRRRGDLREISQLAYGTPTLNNRVFYALLTGKADQDLAEAISKFYTDRLAEIEAIK